MHENRKQDHRPDHYYGDRSLVRRGTGPKGHWSEGSLVRKLYSRTFRGGANPTLHTLPHPSRRPIFSLPLSADFAMTRSCSVDRDSGNTELPNVEVCACYFHYCQSLWRKVADVGLASVYRDHSNVRKLIRKVMAAAFLPLALVRNNLHLLSVSREWRSACRRYPTLNTFLDYHRRVYMNDQGHFPPRI